jgi:hypothetical protein
LTENLIKKKNSDDFSSPPKGKVDVTWLKYLIHHTETFLSLITSRIKSAIDKLRKLVDIAD